MVSTTPISLMVERSGKSGKSLLMLKPNKIMNASELRYLPEELTTDVEMKSRKAHKILLDNIEQVAELRRLGLNQSDIAKKFEVGRHAVQAFLKKYLPEVNKESLAARKGIVEYYFAKTQSEKDKAFAAVDKLLQTRAKTKIETCTGATYEDTIQDLRLFFFDRINNAQEKNIKPDKQFVDNLLQAIKETEPELKTDKRMVYIEEILEEEKNKWEAHNSLIDKFEMKDFYEVLVQPTASPNRHKTECTPRQYEMIKAYFYEGKTIEEMGKAFSLTRYRIRTVLSNIYEKLKIHSKEI